ncbi:hypothetical protein [Streptomyces sp. HUAS TT20]|uniref:hypothetical protein n=1 Tax=Streptomyces sp. HUAS TT20 TaxID=3447509 RepID=UPI0021DA4417|nr:hypothetical protein [Streptomyces sp. HUAS 15-9]UXY33211.1 hypothetical protein N8I87_43680 [Streptomyces sp. HUAS 15-9]
MPSTDPTPTTALRLLDQATALVRERTARLGTEPTPAPTLTVVLDDAPALLAGLSGPERDRLTELMTSGRAAGVRIRGCSRLPRQYATLAELDAAAEHGDL